MEAETENVPAESVESKEDDKAIVVLDEVKATKKVPDAFRPPVAPAPKAAPTSGPAVERPQFPATLASVQETPYAEPSWASPPPAGGWSLLVMRGGVELGTTALDKSAVVFGRLPQADFRLEHPSISRFHAVLQFGANQAPSKEDKAPVGWHIFDLGSTHGSWRNKDQLPPKQFVRLRAGQMCKFGGSSRLFLLQGPEEDEEEETKETLTELKAKVLRRKKAMDKILNPDADFDDPEDEGEEKEKKEEDVAETGISWGMDFDDIAPQEFSKGEDGEDEGEELDFETMQKREEYYKSDPKKALRKFYERTGNDMDFTYEESGLGPKHAWTCRLELPVDTPSGAALVAEATTGGSKRDAAAQCSLEACRMLDAQGLLHPSAALAAATSRQRKRKAELAQNDFYEDEDDDFLDRTGTLEAKRLRRKLRLEGSKAGGASKAMGYEQLLARQMEIKGEMAGVEQELAALQKAEAAAKAGGEGEDLDTYMREIRREEVGGTREAKLKKSTLRQQLVQLQTEAAQVERMAKVAKPVALPTAQPSGKGSIWVGSMKGRKRTLAAPTPAVVVPDDEDEPETGSGAPFDFADEKKMIKESVPAATKEETLKAPKSDVKESAADTKPKPPSKPADEAKSQPEPISEEKKVKSNTETAAPDKPDDEKTKKKRHRVRHKKHQDTPEEKEYDGRDPDYAVWLPPDNQSGDGRTDLNDKLGY